MIVYGGNDKRMGEKSYNNLKSFPNSERFIQEGAPHPCYIDKPDEWHQLVYNFLNAVEKS